MNPGDGQVDGRTGNTGTGHRWMEEQRRSHTKGTEEQREGNLKRIRVMHSYNLLHASFLGATFFINKFKPLFWLAHQNYLVLQPEAYTLLCQGPRIVLSIYIFYICMQCSAACFFGLIMSDIG